MNSYQHHQVDDDLPHYPEFDEIYASPMRKRYLRLAPTSNTQGLSNGIGRPQESTVTR